MKRISLIAIFWLVFAAVSFGQTAQDFFSRGVQQYKNKQYQEAIVNFSEAIRLNPNAPEPWFNRGQANFYTGNMESAIADYSQALRLKPTATDALFQRGLARNK